MPRHSVSPAIAELRERIARRTGGTCALQFCPSGRKTSTEGFRDEGWGLGVCMRWRAAAVLLTARIAVRTKGKVFRLVTRPDLFARAIALPSLAPDRVIHVNADDQKALLACFE